MTDYRRHWLAGGTFFFTVALAERKSSLLVDRIDDLKHAIRAVNNELPFYIVAMAVLPDHLHAVWTLPENDADYATRWKKIKAQFSRCVPRGERRSASRIAKSERGIWQRRYWEHTVRDETDLRRCRLHSLQPCKTRPRPIGSGVAALDVSPLCARGCVSG